MQRRSFLKLVGGAGVGVALSGCATPVRKTVAGMPYRELGRTGLEVSVVAYGGLTLYHGTQEEGTASLRRAFDRAVNYFDVAPAYGNGDAEVKMGIGLQGLPRDRYVLANKTKKRDAAGAREELERSLVRLKTDHFDVYQFHCFVRPAEVDQVCGPGGALETVLKARAEGKVRAIGFSAHTTAAALRAMELFSFDTVMFPINHVEYFNRGFGRAVLARAQQQGVPVLAIKAISAGAWPAGVKKERNWWYRALETQPEIDLAYRWVLSQPQVVMGYSPSWMDLQDRAIAAGHAYRPATAEDEAQVQAMARDTGTLFKREEDSLARGNFEAPFYADYDHGHIPPALA